jgi:hypothetical protein
MAAIYSGPADIPAEPGKVAIAAGRSAAMTRNRDFKDIVRARMARTGESYAAARAQLTTPARGETFETGTAEDGTTVYRMFTKLQTPTKGWSGLAVPSDLLGLRRRVWLRGTLEGNPFWVSAQPMGDGNHWVTVNRQMRAEMGLVGDEEVEAVFVMEDGPPDLEVPEDMRLALQGSREAAALWEGMRHNFRKEYRRWIAEAKRPETRARRVGQAIERIIETEGRAGI